MSDQPEALRLAQALNNRQECEDDAADELRRLHAENQELLEALKRTKAFVNSVAPHGGLFERINAVIARAEGEKP